MPRLIDADKAKEVLTKLLYETAMNNSGGASLMCEDIAENRLETWFGLVPTVDAEPVVRCKDCKWYEIEQLKRDGTDDKRYKPSVCVIGAYAEPRKADWYCADGERREDGNNDRN